MEMMDADKNGEMSPVQHSVGARANHDGEATAVDMDASRSVTPSAHESKRKSIGASEELGKLQFARLP